jgi:hypothetical protein
VHIALNTSGWVLVGIVLLGCSRRPDTPQELQAKWSAGHEWHLSLKSESGASIGEVKLRLTDQKATSCLVGDWLKVTTLATTIEDPTQRSWFTSPSNGPVYQPGREGLNILLNPDICDGYFVLVGSFESGIARGMLRTLSIEGSNPIGTFEASVVE